jgi:plastocyanin
VRLRRAAAILLGGGVIAATAAGCGGLANDEPDLVAGKQKFAEKCGSCHTLARAQTKGVSGPNLDEAFRQALLSGMGRDGVRGAVAAQIADPAIVPRDSKAYMPPDLAKGEEADDIAAYVAESVARPGEDQGLLAEAVQQAGGGEPAVAEGGELEIEATAQLAYVTDKATAEAGELTIKSPNPSGTPHNIALEGNGVDEVGEVVQDGGVSEISATVEAGEYTFYCSVEGHREGGMEGTLTVE